MIYLEPSTPVFTKNGVFRVSELRYADFSLSEDSKTPFVSSIVQRGYKYTLSNGFSFVGNCREINPLEGIQDFNSSSTYPFSHGYLIGYHYSQEDFKKGLFNGLNKLVVEKRWAEKVRSFLDAEFTLSTYSSLFNTTFYFSDYVCIVKNLDYKSFLFRFSDSFHNLYGYDFSVGAYPYNIFRCNKDFVNGFLSGYIEQRLNFARKRNCSFPQSFFVDVEHFPLISILLGLTGSPVHIEWMGIKKVPCWRFSYKDNVFWERIVANQFFGYKPFNVSLKSKEDLGEIELIKIEATKKLVIPWVEIC